jgi:hypothetical protein
VRGSRLVLLLASLGAPGLTGCTSVQLPSSPLSLLSTGSVKPPPPQDCDPGSRECVEQRSAKLRGMLGDRKNAWIDQPPANVADYANGTRLFAYRMQRAKLSCHQLATGFAEVSRVAVAYSAAVAGVVPVQSERVRQLAGEVRGEIASEKRRRCKA